MAHTRLAPLLRWSRTRSSDQPDFGDHGTAFGMELSLAPAAAAPSAAPSAAPAQAAHGAAAAAPLPAAPTGPTALHATPTGMWRRLSQRRAWRDG